MCLCHTLSKKLFYLELRFSLFLFSALEKFQKGGGYLFNKQNFLNEHPKLLTEKTHQEGGGALT